MYNKFKGKIMKKILLVLFYFYLTPLFATSILSDEELNSLPLAKIEPTAVSKVMERFSKNASLNSMDLLEIENNKSDDTTLLSDYEMNKLEIITPIKTATFETESKLYPSVEKEEQEEKKSIEKLKENNSSSIALLEENARQVIAQETQKVEDAKKHALEKIEEVMKILEEAKSKEN